MIIGFVGTPGSGKTYEAVKKICDNLSWGRVVFTNIRGLEDPKCLEMIKNVCGLSDLALKKQLQFLPDELVPSFWNHISPECLIVIDEVHKFFDSRQWQQKENQMFASWASTHRHMGYDLVLITQATARVDSAVRALFEWVYEYRKINYFGSLVTNKYICNSFDSEDTSAKPLAQDRRNYDQKYFRCYKSYAAKDIKELSIMPHVNVLKHPVFYIIPVLFCFLIYQVFHSSLAKGDLFGTGQMLKEQDKRSVSMMQQSKSKDKNLQPSGAIASVNRNGLTVYTNKGK